MALVCDITSEPTKVDQAADPSKMEEIEPSVVEQPQNAEQSPPDPNEDLEDGEIEDDGEEDEVPPEPPQVETQTSPQAEKPVLAMELKPELKGPDKTPPMIGGDKLFPERKRDRDRGDKSERHRHKEEKVKHMTEAEKSILHLRKRERMQRELYARKEGKYNFVVDDFARNIEKSLAIVLKKEKSCSEDEKEDETKRGKKRKKHDRENRKRMKRQQQQLSPRSSDPDDADMLQQMQCGSPPRGPPSMERTPMHSGEESFESDHSSDAGVMPVEERRVKQRKGKRIGKKNRKGFRAGRERSRDRDGMGQMLKDSQGVCVFYLQGKCQKNDCPYSHEAVPPMKLELCKFYLMDCCAKGEKCSYMHSEFPCKFYHTGLQCHAGDDCKFAHGKPLSDGLKQILFKHIETAPRDILGGFPRMSREEALNMINLAQKTLREKYNTEGEDGKGIIPSLFEISVPVPPELNDGETPKPREKPEKPTRNRPSRWQDHADPKEIQEQLQNNFGMKPFVYGKDQDMRFGSSVPNGDVDMRTLPPIATGLQTVALSLGVGIKQQDASKEDKEAETGAREPQTIQTSSLKDTDIRSTASLGQFSGQDMDIRQQLCDPRMLTSGDVDIRQLPPCDPQPDSSDTGLPSGLAKTQRDLFMRIQAQQKDVTTDVGAGEEEEDKTQDSSANINWYSDDDDDDENRLTIRVDPEDGKEEQGKEAMQDIEPRSSPLLPEPFTPSFLKPEEVVNKLGDLSKIDISAEVTKLLSSIGKGAKELTKDTPKPAAIRDPRAASSDPRGTATVSRGGSSDSRATLSDPRGIPTDPRTLGDLRGVLSDFGTPSSDPRGMPSDTKGISNDPRGLSNDSRGSFSDSRGIFGDSRGVFSDSRGIGSESRGVSIDSRGISSESRGISSESRGISSDPRGTSSDPRGTSSDPRQRSRHGSGEAKQGEKVSIYEQGGLDMEAKAAAEAKAAEAEELDFRKLDSDMRGRPDVDLRSLQIPLKGMQNYTPATEIDASINAHPPMSWRLQIIQVPRPDYTGLKLSISDAEKTGDPRLRKLFRLSIEEKDSPMSPTKDSPKASGSTAARVDPRLRKMEEGGKSADPTAMSYMQQLNTLQSSVFYQSLTSNQKLLLNQELANRADQGGSGLQDPVLGSLLTKLNLIPGSAMGTNQNTAALSILSNIGKVNPMLNAGPMGANVNPAILSQNSNLINQISQSITQPGLLGAAPGIPNLTPDFPINFDPRNGGLLGNAPSYPNFQQDPGFGNNYNDDFYQDQGNMNNFNHPGNERVHRGGFNRDRRRGRNNFNRQGRHNFRNNRNNNNRSNRSHSPP